MTEFIVEIVLGLRTGAKEGTEIGFPLLGHRSRNRGKNRCRYGGGGGWGVGGLG